MSVAQLGGGSTGGRGRGAGGSRGRAGLRSRVSAALRTHGGRTAIVVAVALALLLVALVAIWARSRGSGFVIERGAASSQTTGEAGAAASSASAATDAATSAPATDVAAASMGAAQTASVVTVHVDGAVQEPGVYELGGASPRVNDAVAAAGGLVSDADTTSLNLAASVADGDKVHVPRVGEEVSLGEGGSGAASATGSGTGAGASSGSGASGPVNINSATVEELDALPGVGPSTAQAIVDDRTQNGPFASIEDLMRVSGIGEKKFEKLKGHIRV